MDGLLLLEASTSRPILRSHFAGGSPSYPLALTDAIAAAVSRARATGSDVEPIVWLPGVGADLYSGAAAPADSDEESGSDESDEESEEEDVESPPRSKRLFDDIGQVEESWAHPRRPSVERSEPPRSRQGPAPPSRPTSPSPGTYPSGERRPLGGAFCCHILRGGVRLACAVSTDVPPAVPFAFLDSFAAILTIYLKTITPTALQENFDIVLQLMSACLAATAAGAGPTFGPSLTEPGALKELVPTPGLVARMMSAVNAAGIAPLSNPSLHPFSSPIPWRPNGLKYQSNEVYLDIAEEISVILDRHGHPLVSAVAGSIDCKAKLSGHPDLLLTFANPTLVTNPTFHPCVRYSKWTASRSVSFVPPDGRSTLMTFQVGQLPTISSTVASGGLAGRKVLGATVGGGLVPLSFRPTVTIGAAGGSFTFLLASLLSPSISFSSVVVRWRLGKSVEGVSATISGGRILGGGPSTEKDRERESGGGSWTWDGETGSLIWRLERVSAMEREARLSGTWLHRSSGASAPAPSIEIGFEVPTFSVAGVKVDKLKLVGGETYNMYKGVRSRVRSAKVEVRW